MAVSGEKTKVYRAKFLKHLKLLMWKSYVQRLRRWQIAALQALFAAFLFLMAVSAGKPVFLTPLQAKPTAMLTADDILMTLNANTQLGYAPHMSPYTDIMTTVAYKLGKAFMTGSSEEELNEALYEKSKGHVLKHHVIWVIWKGKVNNVWKFSIRSTELAELTTSVLNTTKTITQTPHNRHLRVGFLAVQLAVSEALLETDAQQPLKHKIKLKAMPISPLMQKETVRQAMVWILLCFTLAFIPPVMEVSELVVHETSNEYKRGLCMRNVGPACIYLGWLAYLLITALPILMLATLALILIFRWVSLFEAFLFLTIYITVMTMTAFIVCMFHWKSHIAAIWSALFTLLQLFLADLLVHHGFDGTTSFTILLHILLPPLGLVHGFNEFALLQTGREGLLNTAVYDNHTLFIWILMIFIYFLVLMMLQRTIGNDRAIGGQVSWRSIVFKQAEDQSKLHFIHTPIGNERDKLQEVDELLAKAITFNNVSKSIMGVSLLKRVTLDIYRGEYTQLFAERIQERMLKTLEDLITGLTLPDEGSVNILGQDMAALSKTNKSVTSMPGMLGYCHRPGFLVDEFSVEETLQFFIHLYLWDQGDAEAESYMLIHVPQLLKNCDLQDERGTYVRNLGPYYKAQLCWAIAMILEPRIVFIQSYEDGQKFVSVINDKIVKYRTHLTIVKLSFSTSQLEHADRVFLFDRKILVFGGSPAYMFFKYGREYRVRMTFRARGSLDNHYVEELIDQALDIGGQVRSYVGTLLILRLPTIPTDKTADFVKDITEHSDHYGITSLNISLPDSEEIFKRAINESRKLISSTVTNEVSLRALRQLSKPKQWKRQNSFYLNTTLLGQTLWKYISFYIHYRFFLIITILSAMVTGAIIGVFLSYQLNAMGDTTAKMHGDRMTVEALRQSTTVLLKVDNTTDAMSIATSYAMSHTNATYLETYRMGYNALPYTESLTEYLMLRAIDSPQHYVYMYAYGMEVKDEKTVLDVHVLYSPIHHDTAAAARSLARTYMSLLRHYTGKKDADIQITDDPLVLDSSPAQKKTVPPLLIHLMLIITIAHITLLPTMEHGLVRHMQLHAMNFSPARYWFSLFCCDILLYWTLVFIITTILFCVMYWVAPMHFLHRDLIVIPFMLIMYGLSCVPQAYLFSLGPSAALNSMSFVIFNIIFGEASVISQFIHGDAFNYAERALSLSPQYNVASAFMRITKIFVYNSECVIFNNKKLCSSNVLHRCCKKCGIMQACFERIAYLSRAGILDEILWTVYHSIIFSTLLIIWEYKILQRLWYCARNRWFAPAEVPLLLMDQPGSSQERENVAMKRRHMKQKYRKDVKDSFGEHLLIDNLTARSGTGAARLSRLSFGIGKGEALALVGLSDFGDRLMLCKILAGLQMPAAGRATVMSRWSLTADPHKYSRNVAFSCFELSPLPPWMTVYDAMWMIAVLRGVPKQHVNEEVTNLLDALDLGDKSEMNVLRLRQNEQTRLNFAVAMIGAPPVLILDEFTAYQQHSVCRAMFYILYHLRKQGNALLVSSASVENHMAVTNRVGILLNGQLVDLDDVDSLVARYSQQGYTVVVHLKDEVDVEEMFANHFEQFTINDVANVLANVQVEDALNYAQIFGKMEELLKANDTVYSYIISVTAMNSIYNDLKDKASKVALIPDDDYQFWPCLKFLDRKKKDVSVETLMQLEKFEKRYDIASLAELPWSVIFRR